MRQKITIERITCDICGHDDKYTTEAWREFFIDGESFSELCSSCGYVLEKVLPYMVSSLNINGVLKTLRRNDDD